MIVSGAPAKIPTPWGVSASGTLINVIPATTATSGYASWAAGWTATNAAIGGIPPRIQDDNGVLNSLSAWAQWFSAGAPVAYDATFQTTIGGYPNGAVVQDPAITGLFWLSTADSNTGTLGTVASNGAGWLSLGTPRMQQFTASGTWTCPAGVNRVRARVWGAGGSGGSSLGGTTTATGAGGGAYGEGFVSVTQGTVYAVNVGIGGAAPSTGPDGVVGTASVFNGITANGGTGGGGSVSGNPPGTGGAASGATFGVSGQPGAYSFAITSGAVAGSGGSCGFAGQPSYPSTGFTGSAHAGGNGVFPGGGGGGGFFGGNGGAGANGLVILEW